MIADWRAAIASVATTILTSRSGGAIVLMGDETGAFRTFGLFEGTFLPRGQAALNESRLVT